MAAVGTVASVLAEHVTFRLACVDRVFLQGYIPATPRPIVSAWRQYDTELQALIRAAAIAA